MQKLSNVILFIFLTCLAVDGWSFTLIFKDGRRLEGTWIGENQRTIRVKDQLGVIRSYDKSQLDMKAMATSSRMSTRDPKLEAINQPASVPEKPEPEPATQETIPPPADHKTVPDTGRIENSTMETPRIPKISTKRWALDAGFSNVYESNIHHDEEDIVESVGVVSSLNMRFRNRPSNPNLLFRYEIGLHEYSNTDVWDRVSHNIRAAHLLYLGKKVVLENGAEIALNGSSEDRELTDSYGLRPVLTYFITKSTKLEAFASYRLRNQDNGTKAINRYAGFGFLQEWKDHEFEGYYRYEYNDSENFRNDRYVSTYFLGYALPVTEDLTASFGARLRAARYLSRLVEIDVDDGPDIEFLRRDRKWNFKFALEIPLGKKLELVPEYEYEIRTSNDPEKKYDAHGAYISLVYSLW